MTSDPPAGQEPGARARGVGPFSVRQLGTVLAVVVTAAVALVVLTRPIAQAPGGGPTLLPAATPYLVGQATTGLNPGDAAPELGWAGADGTQQQLRDLDGRAVTLAGLRGRLVLLNFWATWCPPCQAETPVLRDLAGRYAARGLEIVGVAVQETTVDDVRRYAQTYQLPYRIAFDATADIFNLYRIYALPTQVLVGTDGRVVGVVNGPLTLDAAAQWIEPRLPAPPPGASGGG